MLFSLVFSTLVLSVNRAPVVTVTEGAEPVVLNYGESVELPIHVSDANQDPITLYYKFDDATEWEYVPMGDRPNVVPGSLFAHLDPNADHTMHLYASDGQLDSQPVSFGFLDFFKKCQPGLCIGGVPIFNKSMIRKPWIRVVKTPKPTYLNMYRRMQMWKAKNRRPVKRVRPPPKRQPPKQEPPKQEPPKQQPPKQEPPEQQPPEQPEDPVEGEWQQVGIPNTIQSLRSNSVGVSYSFDDSGVWSEPVSYPLGDMEVLIPFRDFLQYGVDGTHMITFRYAEAGDIVNEDSLEYSVNNVPVIQATGTDTLSFKETPSEPVTLPLSVMDGDGDEVTLWYRFDGQGDWTDVPAGLEVNQLPAEAFAGRQPGSSGYVEVVADDGYDHSDGWIKIGYSIEGDAEKNDGFFGTFSAAAFAGIIGGAVAVIALASAIIVVATRRKKESSSTGLIESE